MIDCNFFLYSNSQDNAGGWLQIYARQSSWPPLSVLLLTVVLELANVYSMKGMLEISDKKGMV